MEKRFQDTSSTSGARVHNVDLSLQVVLFFKVGLQLLQGKLPRLHMSVCLTHHSSFGYDMLFRLGKRIPDPKDVVACWSFEGHEI
jgi:hypothetical protein